MYARKLGKQSAGGALRFTQPPATGGDVAPRGAILGLALRLLLVVPLETGDLDGGGDVRRLRHG